jgi:FtsZ-interacting cell division protein ZipA
MPTWLIWAIMIVVVIVVVAALVSVTGKRRSGQRHERAEELRQEATSQAAGLSESERQAEELRAKADLARSEAQRAEEQAANAEQGHQVEQAGYEDKLREADRLDPEVDHRAPDYEPDVWSEERSESSESSESSVETPVPEVAAPRAEVAGETEHSGPRHAASPDESSVAHSTEDPEAPATTRGEPSGDEPPASETPTERPPGR